MPRLRGAAAAPRRLGRRAGRAHLAPQQSTHLEHLLGCLAHAPLHGLLHRLSHLRPRQFPLDSDDILIRVGPKEYTDQDVVLEIDAKKHGTEGASGDRIKSSNLEEWELGNPSVRIERSGPTGSGNYYSNVVFCVCVT